MKVLHRGFSLIEALVSLLVLSVGVLGLCRLQVALWSSSSALHATALASLLAGGQLERWLTPELHGIDPTANETAQFMCAGRRFKSALSVSQSEDLTTTAIHIEWTDPAGTQSLALATATDNQSTAADSRWLLPPR